MSMADESAPQMKPQDSIIFALGEIKGQLTSLIASVEQQSAQQIVVNTANEKEHSTFREHLSVHDTAIALLKETKATEKESKLANWQKVSLAISAPSAFLALITVLTIHFTK